MSAAELRLTFVGDVMLDEIPGQLIKKGRDPFEHVQHILADSDYCVANLECAVAATGKPADKKFTFRAHPRVMSVLKSHFDAVSVANNHAVDFGREAFLETLGLLKARGISYIGGGDNCATARRPVIVDQKGIRVALLAYNDYQPRSFEAGPSWPGVAWAVEEQMIADIEYARDQLHADLVIPFMHWGTEHCPIDERQRALAYRLIDHGADMIVGGHPHVVQGAELYKNKLIVYSLGNFVFNGFDPGPSRHGWILRLRIDSKRLIAWETLDVQIDNDGLPHIERDRNFGFRMLAETSKS